ncbi:hypothetical protein ACQKJZ_00170 [Sphingomonas sp. NPDC019816]|uniref:hypothetical protein n=1 Tax=Sphingomonas sp. NPDC019816 TaxID=3390679 RepID=UPI003CFC0D87
MVRMAAPFKDPHTGIFYFRRVILAALRPFFDGVLRANRKKARQRYHPHALVYDQKLAAARRGLASQQFRRDPWSKPFLAASATSNCKAWPQKLASLEFDAFRHVHGLTNYAPLSCYDFGSPPERSDLQIFRDRKTKLEAVPDSSRRLGFKRHDGFTPSRRWIHRLGYLLHAEAGPE